MGNKQSTQIINKKEKINNYYLYYKIQTKRCVTSFALLKDNKMMLTFKGGILVIYEFIQISDKKEKNFKLKEIFYIEKEEYCFNYGIELKNGNMAICSEDSTINIIKLILLNKKVSKDGKNKLDNNNNKNNNSYDIDVIQKIDLGNEPLYIIKEFVSGKLVVGSWNNIFIFIKPKINNKYELMTKLIMKDRTFSLIELNKGEIISSQCYSKLLTIYKINSPKFNVIKDIESNESPNIICKFNNQNKIVFVACNNGINVVSIINKCLIKTIKTNQIITSICPFISHYQNKEIFSILCGAKERIYNEKINYRYNLLQIYINLDEEKEIITIKNSKDNKSDLQIKKYDFLGKDSTHRHDINQIENVMFCQNNIFNIKKEEQIIITSGSEDKNLIFWRNHK